MKDEEIIKAVAVDFFWENSIDKAKGYQEVRRVFDEWFAGNKYFNPIPWLRVVEGL